MSFQLHYKSCVVRIFLIHIRHTQWLILSWFTVFHESLKEDFFKKWLNKKTIYLCNFTLDWTRWIFAFIVKACLFYVPWIDVLHLQWLNLLWYIAGVRNGERMDTSRCPGTRTTSVESPPRPATLWYKHSRSCKYPPSTIHIFQIFPGFIHFPLCVREYLSRERWIHANMTYFCK